MGKLQLPGFKTERLLDVENRIHLKTFFVNGAKKELITCKRLYVSKIVSGVIDGIAGVG